MKRNKLLIILFTTFFYLGCNSNNNHQLICNIRKDNEKQTITFYFNKDNSRVLDVNVETVTDISSYDDLFKQQLINFSSKECSNMINCNVLVENDKIVENMRKTGDEFFVDNRKSIQVVQKSYEEDGYSCK